MTSRHLPKINPFAKLPDGVDFEAPVHARERWTPVNAKHEDERTLMISGRIGKDWDGTGVTVDWVRGFLRRVGAGPVTINLNSAGGDFFEGAAIYNMLREHDGEVQTNVLGLAASAASVIAMASDELLVAKAGFLMIHNSWAIALGNQHDMTDAANMLAKFDKVMANVYADRSGMSVNKITDFMDKETFFSGEESVDVGLADGLLESDQVVPADENEPSAALRKMDTALARAGIPRSERRNMINEIPKGTPGAADSESGTPGAATNATPSAGDDIELLAMLRAANKTFEV